MFHGAQSVSIIVGIGVHFRSRSLARSRMGMRHRQRLVSETVRGRGGFHTAQQVVAHGLDDTALTVVMIHRTDLVGTPQNCHFRTRQEAFAKRCVSRRITRRKTAAAHKAVVVVVVTDMDRSTACSLVGAFPLNSHTAEGIIQVIGVLVAGALVAILRENQAVGIVIFVRDVSRSRQALLAAQVAAVVLILECIQTQVGSGLVFRLEHQHKVAEIVVHAVGIQILASVHAAFQYRASLLVSEGVGHMVVLVRSLHHMERTGGIVAGRGAGGIVELARLYSRSGIQQVLRPD